jgi:hypothetical protein
MLEHSVKLCPYRLCGGVAACLGVACVLLCTTHTPLCYYGPGIDSASNRNEYQEHFLGVKAAGA